MTAETLPEGEDWVYYGLTPKQYEAMSKNLADIFRWVQEAAWRLRYYRGEEDPVEGSEER